MRRRLSAVLLATGLAVSVMSAGVYADETETAAVTEQETEAVSEAVTEAVSEAVSEAAAETAAETESEAAAAGETEGVSEAETQGETEDQLTTYINMYKNSCQQLLSQLGTMSDEELNSVLESGEAASAAIVSNWMSVKEELGAFVEVTEQEAEILDETKGDIQIINKVKYEKADDKTEVLVTYKVDQTNQSLTVEWEIDYPLGTLMKNAALNTLMGVGIVFLVLLFLSFLISKLHIIPDKIEARRKANAPAPAPIPAAPAVPAVPAAEEEEELADDTELVAVIAAAIAAAENTSADGFVVRSIKKSNRRNRQRA